MRFDWWTLALQTVNFAVLVWLLQRFLYRPVLRLVEARRAAVEQAYDAAKAAVAEADALRAAAEAERARLAASREAALAAAAAEAEAAAKARKALAEREAAALVERTRKDLEGERAEALAAVQRAALDLATDLARRVLVELPDDARAQPWLPRITGRLAALPDAERAALAAQLADGTALRVATAVALPADVAEAWRGALRRALGDRAAIAFEVDSALVAGAELRFPCAILKLSWQSALTALRAEVEAHDAG